MTLHSLLLVVALAQTPAVTDTASSYPRLTLDEVVKRTVEASPTVAGGEGGVTDAISARRAARASYFPSLSVSGTSTGINTMGIVSNPPILGRLPTTSIAPVRIRNQTLGLSAAADLYTGGLRRANEAFTAAELRSSRFALVADRSSTELTAVEAFYEVNRATENVNVARTALEESGRLLRYTLDKSRAGTAMRSDVLRAQLDVTTSREALVAAKDTLTSAAWTLGWLTGSDGPVGAQLDSESQTIRPLAWDDSTVIRYAAASSPTVNYANAVEDAGIAGVRAARAAYRPTITAATSYIWATDRTVVTSTSRPGLTMTVGTAYPVFNGYQREDSVVRARVSAEISRVTAADTRRSTRASAARFLSMLHTAESSIGLGEEAIRSAREDLRVQEERYRAGVSTILDVLISQTALTRAGYSLTLARQQYHVAHAQLEALLGRRL